MPRPSEDQNNARNMKDFEVLKTRSTEIETKLDCKQVG